MPGEIPGCLPVDTIRSDSLNRQTSGYLSKTALPNLRSSPWWVSTSSSLRGVTGTQLMSLLTSFLN
eukprot:6651614-Ditylum_brightwellii.AAC.1